VDYGQRFVQALEMHTFCWSSQSLWLLWALTQSRMLPNSIRKKHNTIKCQWASTGQNHIYGTMWAPQVISWFITYLEDVRSIINVIGVTNIN
jgi:hypothetical protein